MPYDLRFLQLISEGKPVLVLPRNIFGLIITRATGVFYLGTCGGYSNDRLCHEGVFFPFTYDEGDMDHAACQLEDYFGGPKWNYECCEGIDTETADFIDNVLQHYPLRVDRSRLKDSEDAWVYVDVFDPTTDGPYIPITVSNGIIPDYQVSFADYFNNLGPCKAVLVWPNSD